MSPALRVAAAWCAALTLSIVTSCVGASDPLPSVVSVSLTLNRTSLRLMDTLVIKVLGTNTSDHTIEVPNYPCLASVDVRNERDEPVNLGDPVYCTKPLFAPKILAPGDTWGDTMTLTHPASGQYRVRAGLPLSLGTGDYVYSDYATITVRP